MAALSRPELSGTTATLAVGDLTLITGFVAFGMTRHGGSPTDLPALGDTLAPFLIGWAVASILLGVYVRPGVQSPAVRGGRTAVAWVLAALLALGLRSTAMFGGGFDVAFLLVALLVGGTLLTGWRVALAPRVVGVDRPAGTTQ